MAEEKIEYNHAEAFLFDDECCVQYQFGCVGEPDARQPNLS